MANLPIADNPTFTTSMEAMTADTPGSYEEFNTRYIQLLGNHKYLKTEMEGRYQLKWYHPDYNLDEANIFTGEAEGVRLPEPGKIFLNYKTGHIYKGVIATKGTRLDKVAEATLIQDKVTHTDETIFSLFLALAQSINASQSHPNENAVTTIAAGTTQEVGFQVGTMAIFHENKLIRLGIGYVSGSPTINYIMSKLPEGVTITQYGPSQSPSYGFKITNNSGSDITCLNIYMPSP